MALTIKKIVIDIADKKWDVITSEGTWRSSNFDGPLVRAIHSPDWKKDFQAAVLNQIIDTIDQLKEKYDSKAL